MMMGLYLTSNVTGMTYRRMTTLLLLLCLLFSSSFAFSGDAKSYHFGQSQFGLINEGQDNYPSITYDYERQEQVCQSVLATASDLEVDYNTSFIIQDDLSFINGDWEKSPGNAPLLPFVNASLSTARINGTRYARFVKPRHSPLKVASFWISHVDRIRGKGSRKYISVSGVLLMGIASWFDGYFNNRPYEQNPEFRMQPGQSEISIFFQGIYVESLSSEHNKDERVLCLLGNALLPLRETDSSEPGSFSDQPSLLQDDQILLVLHYPKTPSLLNVAIRGDLKSLNTKGSLKYFDDVHIMSHLRSSRSLNYTSSEKILSKACNRYSNGSSCKIVDTDVYRQNGICSLLYQLSTGDAFTFVPNWKCNGIDEYCSKLGPFLGDKEVNATDGSFKGVGLYMQNVRCQENNSEEGVTSAKVFAIFRAVSKIEDSFYGVTRSGLNNMTVVAEGTWSSSSGYLCMIACLGTVRSEEECDTRVCLYIPLTLTIKQCRVLVGSFSSLSDRGKPYFPLSFKRLVQPYELWQFQAARFQYKYSKIQEAGSVLEKDQPFRFGNIIKKSLMNFPKLKNIPSYIESISLLMEDLTFRIIAKSDPTSGTRIPKDWIQMDIVSLDSVLGHGQAWEYQNISPSAEDVDVADSSKTEYTERQILMNVSAQLTISEKAHSNLSVFLLEGIYDPHVGKMYMVGCRDVQASWKILYDKTDLEDGLDCQIEAVVSYPPTTARWLMNPSAKIFVSSKRNEDDPLHFPDINLETLPLFYRTQREDILSHSGVEGILRILTLTMTVGFILSQLFYMRKSMDSVPFISLVMLGVQVLGYGLHLVTGAETILGGMASKSSYENPSYELEKNIWFKLIGYCVKLLVLVSVLLTLRLCQKVWKSRSRLLSSTPLGTHGVPSDKLLMIIIFITHLVGYATVVFMHTSHSDKNPSWTEIEIDFDRNPQQTRGWETQLEEYVGLIQDFFLLPQIIGNLLWQINCKPLRKLYYIGITTVRVLPHIYAYVREPIPSPYYLQNKGFVNPAMDFYSKSSNIFIPTVALIFTLIIYIQQRWSYEKIGQTLTIGHLRLLPSASIAYQRLPSKMTGEAELVPGTGNNSDNLERNDNEESRS